MKHNLLGAVSTMAFGVAFGLIASTGADAALTCSAGATNTVGSCTCSETVTVPKGEPSVDVEIKVDPKLNPGRHNIRLQVAGFVGKYEESLNLPGIPIEVKKSEQK